MRFLVPGRLMNQIAIPNILLNYASWHGVSVPKLYIHL